MSNDGNFLRLGLRSSSNPVVPPLMGTRLLFFSMIWDWKLSRLLWSWRVGVEPGQVEMPQSLCSCWHSFVFLEYSADFWQIVSLSEFWKSWFFFGKFSIVFMEKRIFQRSLLCHFPRLVLICILMANNTEHLFMGLCAILIFFDEMFAQIFKILLYKLGYLSSC